jgi:5-formyltetrahydrofolate cyclo-ligase
MEPFGAAATAAQRRILALPELRGAATVLLYAAAAWEVPTDELSQTLARRGLKLLFPRVVEPELELCRANALADLVPGYRGIREPVPDASTLPPEEVDLFVIPGMLFDRNGRRLGRGGGHYDRLLARARRDACRVGLCYAQRVVREIPAAAWDVRMHVVVTEAETIRAEGA